MSGKHWHHNRNWKPGCGEPDYFGCTKENCKKPISEEYEPRKGLMSCQECKKPYMRIGPHSWKGDCKHIPKNIRIACV